MSSIPGSPCRKQVWDCLPGEIRLMILKILIQDGCKLAHLATVSQEWQAELERHNFARIKLTPSRLADFSSMVHRNHALADAVENLFSIVSAWDPKSDLILEISIYSLSNSQHWFKYLTSLPDSPSQTIPTEGYDDAQHGWVAGFRHAAPPRRAFDKIFSGIMEQGPFRNYVSKFEWWDQLPSVPAVASLLLRQQNRRRWKPNTLTHMFARLPRLQEIHYEPWGEWESEGMQMTEEESQYLFDFIRRFNIHLKRLVVFENLNQLYPAILQWFHLGVDTADVDSIRNPDPAVGRMVALASLQLEHLGASFLVNASHFCAAIEPSWEPVEDASDEIGVVLQAAAAMAMWMPRLETMEIWNGRKGLAAVFQYQTLRNTQQATITWRARWELNMERGLIRAWEAVEQLDISAIKSHGDAIPCLRLSSQVIRPVSLQQIQM
ncbi:hypothetical protein N658DRAFT_519301 [Parathielavia hyrcaniae]|uniref:DUF6546 domain-containing protein n=1 Tax=Parathielavia hyrcaniae TaxID=113614 RepID=A0AAN6SWD4_9PEZI|nr:hypothetical protein N658DRAFT_519301 [Parathielavia hyrcaniae]